LTDVGWITQSAKLLNMDGLRTVNTLLLYKEKLGIYTKITFLPNTLKKKEKEKKKEKKVCAPSAPPLENRLER
jgi:hypothetical protein